MNDRIFSLHFRVPASIFPSLQHLLGTDPLLLHRDRGGGERAVGEEV